MQAARTREERTLALDLFSVERRNQQRLGCKERNKAIRLELISSTWYYKRFVYSFFPQCSQIRTLNVRQKRGTVPYAIRMERSGKYTSFYIGHTSTCRLAAEPTHLLSACGAAVAGNRGDELGHGEGSIHPSLGFRRIHALGLCAVAFRSFQRL